MFQVSYYMSHPVYCNCEKCSHQCSVCNCRVPDCDWDESRMCVDCEEEGESNE